jgi:hypothetical protein
MDAQEDNISCQHPKTLPQQDKVWALHLILPSFVMGVSSYSH